jgi:hypothetical protein
MQLSAPTDIKVKNGSPSEMQVYWTDPNLDRYEFNRVQSDGLPKSRRRFYIVEFWNVGTEKNEAHKKMTTDNTKLKISQLEPGQQYAIRIKIVLHGGQESEWSQISYVKTPKDGKYIK